MQRPAQGRLTAVGLEPVEERVRARPALRRRGAGEQGARLGGDVVALLHVGYTGLFEVELEEPEVEMAAAKSGAYVTALCRTMPANA